MCWVEAELFKTHVPESNEAPQLLEPPAVTSDEPWWEWTERHVDFRLDAFSEAVGQVLGAKTSEVYETLGHEIELVKRESQQIRHELNARVELEREREALRAKSADAERTQHKSELESLRRELALVRGELGIDRGLRALYDEVATARSEVPKFDYLEARVATEQSKLRSEQRGIERELAATKARLGKMRVNQSVTNYKLSEHIRALQPVVELKFECADSRFTMKLHPDAAEAWRRFVAEMVEANDGTMSINDPSGRVVALPSRGAA
jgi:chromosome segregation ATPase